MRYTIATAIVAIVGSSLLPVTDGERLATIAYLAVIFAAVTVTALHFVPAGAMAERPLVVTLPAALQSVLLVAIILVLGALFAGQPGAEGLLLLVCAALTAIAAFAGGGFSRTLHGELGAGGMLAALKRYSVLAGALALVLAMVLPAETKAVAVEAACWAVVAATIFLSVSLLGRTGFGRLVMAIFKVPRRGFSSGRPATPRTLARGLSSSPRCGHKPHQSLPSARTSPSSSSRLELQSKFVLASSPIPAARLRFESTVKNGAIAAALAFAAFVVAKGTPTLRHDWNWPIDRSRFPHSSTNRSAGGCPSGSASPTRIQRLI